LVKLRLLSDPSLEWLAAARRPMAVPPANSDTPAYLHRELLWVFHNHSFQGEYKHNLPVVLNLIVKDHSPEQEVQSEPCTAFSPDVDIVDLGRTQL
jgi:hypothetical protein